MLDDFREWLSDNLRYILLGLAVLLVIIIGVCIFRLATGSGKKGSSGTGKKAEVITESITEAEEADNEEAGVTMTAPSVEAGSDLVRDDAAILELVKKYYTAAAEKDSETLSQIVDPWNEEVEERILANDWIEGFENISTYSKAGPVDGSYVVYAYYEGRIKGISTAVPSLSRLYVVTNDSGNLVVTDWNSSTEVADYIAQVSSDDDVQALVADVNRQCEAAQEADPELAAFMEALANGTATEQDTESDDSDEETTSGGTAMATAGVNIRQSASTDAAIMGTLYQGAEVTVVERGTDWSHITFNYNGTIIEGYVASQYLDFGD